MLHFALPLWLIAGLFCCLGAVFFIRFNILRRKKELQQFASPHLLAGLTRNVSLSRRRLKNILLVLGLACLFIGLARPQYGNRWVEIKRKGIDIDEVMSRLNPKSRGGYEFYWSWQIYKD